MKILISDSFSKDLEEKLKELGEVTTDKNELANADVVLVRSATKATKEYIDQAPNLKLIIRGGVGIDNIDVEYCKEKNISVNNTPEASSVAVAELAIAMMLGIRRDLVKAHNATKSGEWIKKQLKGRELYKKTLGLIGIGRIGQEVAKRAKAFEMNVIAYDPYVKESEIKLVELDELLKSSDFISLHTPLTDETRGMVNKDLIAKMKDGAILINTARGKLLNEQDVYDALQSGKLGFAGLDVYQSEPPEGSPLLKADNVLLAPHIGASTHENMDRIGEIVIKQIKEFQK
ncbi:MAG: hydroxyacid dehydrogenase [Thermoplasmata archaeon]|nr:MAG: hydroxyacid dehydrogenase [Thermoplasmata archaeon]